MMFVHPIRLRWLAAEEGGRTPPFSGERYTPTARFVGEDTQFSIVLEFPTVGGVKATALMRLLNPELEDIEQRMHPGVALEIMEGPRMVAHCIVEN